MARKYKKKTERKRLEDKLDKAWSKAIRERDDNECQWCGGEGTQAAHVIPRRYRILRWDWGNGICLCGGCHMWKWHENPLEAADWFENKFPERWEYLLEQNRITVKWSIEELEEMLRELE